MDFVETKHFEEYGMESSSNFLAAEGSIETDECGDPPIPPRIGDEYQVELTPFIEPGNSQLRQNGTHGKGTPFADCSFGIGLAIPVYWVPVKMNDNENETVESTGATDRVVKAESVHIRSRSLNANSISWSKVRGKYEGRGEACNNNELSKGRRQSKRTKCSPLPDTVCISWSDSEMDSFLLGLYIFGKNFVIIRQFIEVKQMGDILSFYYGNFYQSDAYRRWSECRKTKSRKSIQGQRIFTGWRQQELQSRLLSNLSEENQTALLEVTRRFTDGIALLDEYVFRLKAIAGMKALVEAVGIGTGKRDLTGIALDPPRANHGFSHRPDIPIGKACSSLTSAEIISFLKGDFRLSKARSNDLFWEAVWPRLLARGWHSEQPKNRQYPNFRQTLVFLIPGVNKFSRRKLVKGCHYYDSVADVLNKVASDPKLLELDIDGSVSIGEGNNCARDVNRQQSGLTDPKSNHDCEIENPNSLSDVMLFTIVDTSLVQGETPYKITDLRSLPTDNSCKYSSSIQNHDSSSSSDDINSGGYSSSDEQRDPMGLPLKNPDPVQGLLVHDSSRKKTKMLFERVKEQPDPSDSFLLGQRKKQVHKQVPENYHGSLLGRLPVKDSLSQSTHNSKPRKPVYLSPMSKRQRLTACSHPTVGHIYSLSKLPKIEKEGGSASFLASDIAEMESSKNSLGKDTSVGIRDDAFSDSDLCKGNNAALSDEKSQQRMQIDLNIIPDIDANETFVTEVSDNQHHSNMDGNTLSGTARSVDDTQAHDKSKGMYFEQPTTSSRRLGTRNRPPTAKVLESLASGFLGPGRREPGSKVLPSKSSRRKRRIHEVPLSRTVNDSDDPKEVPRITGEERVNGNLRNQTAHPTEQTSQSLMSSAQLPRWVRD